LVKRSPAKRERAGSGTLSPKRERLGSGTLAPEGGEGRVRGVMEMRGIMETTR
jgi:hypothetical protein